MSFEVPAISAKGIKFKVATAPAAINELSPKDFPQIIVELAPKVAPFLVRVLLYSFS